MGRWGDTRPGVVVGTLSAAVTLCEGGDGRQGGTLCKAAILSIPYQLHGCVIYMGMEARAV